MRLLPPKPNPELDRLLDSARRHTMTPEELAAQRKSWVVGEMMLSHPEWTRAYIETRYDAMLKEQGYKL